MELKKKAIILCDSGSDNMSSFLFGKMPPIGTGKEQHRGFVPVSHGTLHFTSTAVVEVASSKLGD
jgi:hypothetical protein